VCAYLWLSGLDEMQDQGREDFCQHDAVREGMDILKIK